MSDHREQGEFISRMMKDYYGNPSPEAREIESLKSQVDELRKERDGCAHVSTQTLGSLWEARARLRDFMDYFAPRGGISDVPLGPFERARECLDDLHMQAPCPECVARHAECRDHEFADTKHCVKCGWEPGKAGE